MNLRLLVLVLIVVASAAIWWEHDRHQRAMVRLAAPAAVQDPVEAGQDRTMGLPPRAIEAAARPADTARPAAVAPATFEQRAARLSDRMLVLYRASADAQFRNRLNALDEHLGHLRGGNLSGWMDPAEGGQILDELSSAVEAGAIGAEQAQDLGERMEQAGIRLRSAAAARVDPALLPWTDEFRAEHPLPARTDDACCARQVSQARRLLASKDYARLDALVQELAGRNERLAGGGLALHRFYQRLGRPGSDPDGTAASGQGPSSLRAWTDAVPGSLAARVALAQMEEALAWSSRGGAYAQDLSEQQSSGFDLHMQRALAALAAGDAARDRHAALLGLRLVHALPHPRQQLDERFAAATRAFPDDDAYYGEYAILLQRKWYGRPGELAAWLDSLQQSPGGEHGRLAYAQAMVSLGTCCGLPDLLAANAIRWPAFREAFQLRESRYGLAEEDAQVLFWTAARFLDRNAARHALEQVRSFDARVWGSHEDMAAAIAWAAGSDPQ